MGRVRETAGEWLVVVVPLGVAALALAAYFAWQWYTRPNHLHINVIF